MPKQLLNPKSQNLKQDLKARVSHKKNNKDNNKNKNSNSLNQSYLDQPSSSQSSLKKAPLNQYSSRRSLFRIPGINNFFYNLRDEKWVYKPTNRRKQASYLIPFIIDNNLVEMLKNEVNLPQGDYVQRDTYYINPQTGSWVGSNMVRLNSAISSRLNSVLYECVAYAYRTEKENLQVNLRARADPRCLVKKIMKW
jgi:hypothetical protein